MREATCHFARALGGIATLVVPSSSSCDDAIKPKREEGPGQAGRRAGAAVEVALPPDAYSIRRTGPGCDEAVAAVTLEAGVQLGAANVARRITGFQLGLVNVIRDGQMHLEVFGSDLQPVNIAFKSGSRRFFTTLMVGGGRTGHFLYGFGAGVHLGGDVLWLDADLVSTTTLDVQRPLEHANIGGHLRALGGLQLGPVGVFAGPTANVLVPLRSDRVASGSYLAPLVQLGSVQLWPGVEVGVRL